MLLNCCFVYLRITLLLSQNFKFFAVYLDNAHPSLNSCQIYPQLYTSPQPCSLAQSVESSLCWTTTLGYGTALKNGQYTRGQSVKEN